MPTRLLPDASAFLADMRAVLSEPTAVLRHERQSRSGWAPRPGSPAHLQRKSGTGYTGEWGEPTSTNFGMAMAQLMVATEAIEAQARLLEDPPTAVAHLVLARATVEAFSPGMSPARTGCRHRSTSFAVGDGPPPRAVGGPQARRALRHRAAGRRRDRPHCSQCRGLWP